MDCVELARAIAHLLAAVVCVGIEYQERWPDPKDDKYYRVPRELGIARYLPRTKTLSTSDLIARIQSAQLEGNNGSGSASINQDKNAAK